MSSSIQEIYENQDIKINEQININPQDGCDELISIIVVHRDRPAYLTICLQSILANSVNNNYEIIVVDNGSGKETQEFLDSIEKEIKVVRNKDNLWWSKAVNQGIRAADKNSKYFILLHCDTVVLNPAWLDLLINVSDTQNSGLVGLSLGNLKLRNFVTYVEDWCVLMTREFLETCGPYPEDLQLEGTGFIMTMLAQTKKFNPQAIKNNLVHHYKIQSFDYSEFEVMRESARTTIAKLVSQIQTGNKLSAIKA